MRLVPINEAEAIIEPFWDGGSSEHPADKLSLLGEYQVTIAGNARARVSQGWCAVDLHVDAAEPGAPCVRMARDCDLDVSGYDVFRVFASLPEWARMTVRATVDGREQVLLDGVAGPNTMDEFDGPLSGRQLTRLQIEFALAEPRVAYAALLWLGLSNRALQERLEARRSPYTADWPGLLAADPGRAAPHIGIFFGPRDLDGLRRKAAAGPLKPAFDALRRQAERDLDCEPERDIGFYVPNPDRRWVRNRDMKRARTAGVMERLALVGLVDGNLAMSRMAARMALSAAHCDTWCESVIGLFPGATWHHRSFTEEIYCRACALVLDWAGFCLTPHARQVIRDAIIMKGLPRIESDFKRMEYIRSMNQGIVFSSGRIIGALGLLPAHPRYAGLVDEAERDLAEMIDAYVKPDGGTPEGMAYWDYTFSTVMPLVCALARYRGQTLAEYASPALRRTGDFALGMLSTAGDGTTYLPVNDAHADQRLSPAVAAAYRRISARPEWGRLYAAMTASGAAEPDLYHFIFAPPAGAKAPPRKSAAAAPRLTVFPDTGEVSALRAAKGIGVTHLHLSCGPILATHYHEDRGSFVLEAAGEPLAIDRGVTTYDHPEVALIGDANRHNLIYPESPDGALVHQPPSAAGGRLGSALSVETEAGAAVLLACDTAAAWEPGVFRANIRRVFSPSADLFLFDDEVELGRAIPVSFRLNTRGAVEERDGEMWILGRAAELRVVPLNWTPARNVAGIEGVDSHLEPVILVKLMTGAARSHRLLTAVQVVPAGGSAAWQFERGPAVACTNGILEARLTASEPLALRAQVRSRGRRLYTATCAMARWKVARA